MAMVLSSLVVPPSSNRAGGAEAEQVGAFDYTTSTARKAHGPVMGTPMPDAIPSQCLGCLLAVYACYSGGLVLLTGSAV